ncbi:MAG: hypothetical protein LBG06_03950 [Deltaproteobacteria bacterium]|jgi:hypothetical protein|nr:hypothetical protein [Deltaproteobacteria bacterium]
MTDAANRLKPLAIAWLAFDALVILALILFAVAADGLTPARLAAFAALLLAGTAAAGSLALPRLARPGAPAPLASGGAALAALVYLAMAFAVSLLFMAGIATGLAALVLVQLLLLAVFAAAAYGMSWAARRKSFSDASAERRADGVYGLLSRAETLLARFPQGSPEARSLERSIEEIRYFDKNSSVPTDRLIAERLMDLDEIFNPAKPSPPYTAPPDLLLEPPGSVAAGSPPPPAGDPGAAAPPSPPADPAAQSANAAQLLEEIYRLAIRRKDESLAAKRGSL